MNYVQKWVISAVFVFSIGVAGSINVMAASFERTINAISLTQNSDTNIYANTDPAKSVNYSNTAFELSYGQGLAASSQAQTAFNKAVDTWSYYLNDSITVKLDLDYAPLGANILGSTGTAGIYGAYDGLRDMISTNAGETNNARENALLPALPTSEQFKAYLPDGFSMNGNMSMTLANYHAIGGTQFLGDTAASITFSSNFNWDYDPSDGISEGTYDFVGVAVHEIGHALGFISEVDYVDVALEDNLTTDDVWPYAFDLFRFADADIASEDFDFTTTPRDLEPGYDDSFYYGDGDAQLASGYHNGDGDQASHFKDSQSLGIMDPTAKSGEILMISQNDLIVMDLIGWDVIDSAMIPEPASLVLLALGAAMAFRTRKP